MRGWRTASRASFWSSSCHGGRVLAMENFLNSMRGSCSEICCESVENCSNICCELVETFLNSMRGSCSGICCESVKDCLNSMRESSSEICCESVKSCLNSMWGSCSEIYCESVSMSGSEVPSWSQSKASTEVVEERRNRCFSGFLLVGRFDRFPSR
jgi:hypothetical protein